MARPPDLFLQYSLAERLGGSLARVKAMPEDEFYGWLVYFQQKAEMTENGAKAKN